MTDENENELIMVFFEMDDRRCAAEECGGEFLPNPEPGDIPVVFDVECPNHGHESVAFHQRCMPDEFRQALAEFQKKEQARWN